MTMCMKGFAAILLCLCPLSLTIRAQDITSLEKIGPVVTFTRTDSGVVFNCRDNSQVQITVLAADLIRVRASFAKPIPARDHSWAIAKDRWDTPGWSFSESADSITIATDTVEVVIHRSPLLIDFRDAHTHALLNADQQPMAYDAKGIMSEMMFDPKAGM